MTESKKQRIPDSFQKKEEPEEVPKVKKVKKLKIRSKKQYVLKKGNVLYERKGNKSFKVSKHGSRRHL